MPPKSSKKNVTTVSTSLEQVLVLCDDLRGNKITRRKEALKQLPHLLQIEEVFNTFTSRTDAAIRGKLNEQGL